MNQASVAKAVDFHIDFKVDQLATSKKYDKETSDAVRRHLMDNTNETFL
jgi:hypothetical protein